MTLFLSTHENKLDRKGRVSVPASFRAALEGQKFHGIVAFPSHKHPCLEACSWDRMEQFSQSLDNMDFFSDAQDSLAATIFGNSVQLAFDATGRITLPQDLADFAGIIEKVAFVGMGRTFQIWEPGRLEEYKKNAADRARKQGLTMRINPNTGGQQ